MERKINRNKSVQVSNVSLLPVTNFGSPFHDMQDAGFSIKTNTWATSVKLHPALHNKPDGPCKMSDCVMQNTLHLHVCCLFVYILAHLEETLLQLKKKSLNMMITVI